MTVSQYFRTLLGVLAGSGSAAQTLNFTYAQVSGGIVGATDSVTTAGKQFMHNGAACWTGIVTGTSATIVAHRNAGDQTNMIVVSVDGGAFTAPTYSGSGGIFPLFSGLSDGPHRVIVYPGAAYANQIYFPTTGNIVSVTGATPTVAVMTANINAEDQSGLVAWSHYTISNGANYSPANSASGSNSPGGGNVPSVRFQTTATEMNITTSDRYVFVSVNGAAPTRYDTGTTPAINNPRTVRITGLSSSATTYNVWSSWSGFIANSSFGVFSIGLNAAYTDVGTKRRLDQYGDSITDGVGATTRGEVETMRVAAALGMAGSVYGVSGNTIAQLLTRINGIMPVKTISATNDVAVLAIGRNDATTGVAMTTQQQTDYTSCITALIAKYQKVICRGVIPTQSQDWTTFNASLSTLVSGFGNANVTYCDPNAWSGIAFLDGTHPTDAGYATMAGYAVPAYTPLI